MGDRVSISFRHGADESVVLFSHWDGRGLVKMAEKYVRGLIKRSKLRANCMSKPLDRLEPGIVMVDFIRTLTKDMEVVDTNYYLAKSAEEGDNSDNGHWTIDLETGDTNE